MALLEIRHITRRFADFEAVKDVSFTVASGEFFTLRGPSGCGKTTILRMIAGFDLPDAGQILLDGRDLASTPAEQRPIHTVFQSYALFPHLTDLPGVFSGSELVFIPVLGMFAIPDILGGTRDMLIGNLDQGPVSRRARLAVQRHAIDCADVACAGAGRVHGLGWQGEGGTCVRTVGCAGRTTRHDMVRMAHPTSMRKLPIWLSVILAHPTCCSCSSQLPATPLYHDPHPLSLQLEQLHLRRNRRPLGGALRLQAGSIPREGAVLALDSMVLHKTGRQPDLAHRFIDFMLEGENSAELTNLIGSGNPNRAAIRYIDQRIADNRAVFPDASAMLGLEMLRDLDRKQRRVLNRIWTEIKLR
jgi:energy-coupling factor transporter ATP-binding protein EcfA2